MYGGSEKDVPFCFAFQQNRHKRLGHEEEERDGLHERPYCQDMEGPAPVEELINETGIDALAPYAETLIRAACSPRIKRPNFWPKERRDGEDSEWRCNFVRRKHVSNGATSDTQEAGERVSLQWEVA